MAQPSSPPRRRGQTARTTHARALSPQRSGSLSTATADFEIGDLARRARVSSPRLSLFRIQGRFDLGADQDFHDRHEAVVNQHFDRSLPLAGAGKKARLKASIDFLYADPVAPVVMGKLSSRAAVIALDTGRRSAVAEMAARNIAQGQRNGFIATAIDPIVAGAAIVGGVNQAVAQAISARARPDPDHLAEQLWGFIAGGLSLSPEGMPNNETSKEVSCTRSGSRRR